MKNKNDEVEESEIEGSSVSVQVDPDCLLDLALGEIPGADLLPYLTTIMLLREHRKYSWRGISKWLSDKGNIKVSHTTIADFYQAVSNSAMHEGDWAVAKHELRQRVRTTLPE